METSTPEFIHDDDFEEMYNDPDPHSGSRARSNELQSIRALARDDYRLSPNARIMLTWYARHPNGFTLDQLPDLTDEEEAAADAELEEYGFWSSCGRTDDDGAPCMHISYPVTAAPDGPGGAA